MSSTLSIETLSPTEMLPKALTLVDLLRWRAQEQPDQLAYTFLVDGETEEVSISYGELDRQARAIGASLQPLVAPGDRILLLYPPGLEYIAAFFGCLYAGAVAVPAYPPRRNRNLLRLQSLVADAQATVALTTGPTLARMAPLFSENPYLAPLRWLTSDNITSEAEDNWQEPIITGADLAFLQYTSGSTSLPKGVMLSHGNLLHNEQVIQRAFQQTADSVILGWLPLYHDMGLIGNVIQPLFVGAPCILMSPVAFLQRPFRWLQAISRYRATTSGGPNFAYDLCARKVTEAERATLDLSSWRVAFNGSEPIRHETIENFAKTFEPCGFRREAFYPCYGLAEATLIVSGRLNESVPVVRSFKASALEANLVVEVAPSVEDTKTLVGSGETLPDQEIVIVHPQTLERCLPGQVGEIWVSSPSIAQGYWNQPEQTEKTFKAHILDTGDGPFLRTGDLGFFSEGELFVTGRLKDLIIIRGLNHYPQDIELTVEKCSTALRPGCGAAFSVEVEGEERLVVVQEVDHRKQAEVDAIFEAVIEAVAEAHEIQVYAIVLIKPGSIAKTSSGKIQRHACRAAFLESSLDVMAQWQANIMPNSEATAFVLSSTSPERNAQDIEAWLRSLLAAKLDIASSRVDVNQEIARYGVDSLMAIELTYAVEAALGVVLPVTTFLQSPSIAEIAAGVLEQLEVLPSAPRVVESLSHKAMAEHPLSHGQKALWFLHKMSPESAAYNIAGAVRILSELDVPALRRAFQVLVNRHAALRTTFHEADGKPVQRIHDDFKLCFEEEDASTLSEAALSERLVNEAERPFDLQQGPLLRLSLFRRSAEEHILLLSVHHLVADFWSLAVLTHEMGALYQHEQSDPLAKLAPLALQYTDVVRWQEEALQGAEGEQHWAYWQQQLSGELPVLNLPTDRPRPPVQSYSGAAESFDFDSELLAQLKALGQEHGATLYMTLLAAFQTLLSRYTEQTDIIVGSPTANRKWAEAAGLVGYFVNPVALRGDLSGDPTFETFLSRVRQTVLDAFKHQDYPFPLLVERLHPVREASRSPLFQIQFILQKGHVRGEEALSAFAVGAPDQRINLGGLTLESLPLDQHVAQFDLTLTVAELNGRLSASLQYNTDLFDAATVKRMAGHFKTLLQEVVSQPSQRISRLPLLTSPEKRQLLCDWNDTATDYQTGEHIHQLFEQQAERSPERVALVFEATSLTYRELNSRANRLAHHLRGLGVGPDVPVGLCVERSVEMVVGLLGILKAGGAYVPLDPSYPQERLSWMLEDADFKVVLTQQSLSERLPEHRAHVIALDADWNKIATGSDENYRSATTDENLAYIIYTSGSTGKPKGAMNTHGAIRNRLLWMQEAYQLTETDHVLQKTPYSFDVSVWEFFWPLITGARLVVARPEGHRDAAYLIKLISEQQITTMHFVPSMLQSFLKAEGVESCRSLRQVICSGEALPVELQDAFYARLSADLHNLYGPTEAAIDVTFWPCERESGQRLVPIGRPIANTQIYVLDRHMQPVPVGTSGELYIGGVNLARGYLNRPELTAEKFIPDPFSTEPGARLYKSGDLARFLATGQIEFLGRTDHQVKLRGFRIELGEIEAALVQYRAVREALVMLHQDESGDKRLVAYVVSGESSPTVGNLRAHLKEKLPDYMVPSAYVVLGEMPLTPNGKVDRRALLQLDDVGVESGQAYIAPRTVTEELLAGVWAEILGVERVGINDNFFELGGHSLLATQVISRVRENFSQELPLRELFEYPTIASLAARVEAAMQAGSGLGVPAVCAVSRERVLPLSFGQQRLWFVQQLEPGSSLYNLSGGVRLHGSLNVEVLERTLTELVRRHEALRTTFAVVGGEPVQVIHEAQSVTLLVVHLGQPAEAAGLAREEAMRPFDLERGPLMRVTLLGLADDEHILLLTMHHIVSDGWSVGVLVREIGALYESYLKGEESPLEELEIQYADYAVWQREWLTGDVLEPQLDYWKRQLSGASQVLELPTDYPRPAVQSNRGAQEKIKLSEELSERLKVLSRREGVTLYMTLLAAFQTLLSRYTSQEDILVGTDIANRHRGETEGLIGFFVNLLVLRGDLGGDPTFAELLGRVREACLGAYAHQEMPFEKLVEELGAGRDMSRSPLFQALFVLQNAPMNALELPGLKLSTFEVDSATSKFDLLLSMEEKGKGIEGILEYSTDLFDASTIRRMAGHLETLLENIVNHPEQRISSLPMLTEGERQQLLVGWSKTESDYPQDKCIHGLFEAQAAQTPDAVALVFTDEAITYGELNRRANQLAHYLQLLGVGPEVMVGLCVERSVEMIVGLLGILKAGGAYLPLDAQYPLERLSFMLEDAQVPVLLTQEHLLDALPAHWGQVVSLDSEWELIAGCSEENPQSMVSPENLAYAIYTSGSTGVAKGVSVPHRAVVRLVKSTNYADFSPDEVFLQLAPISFDASTFEVWGSLLNGARLVVMPPQTPSLEELGSALRRYQVTTMWLTAGLFHLMVDERLEDLKSLRQLLAGGDVLSPSHVRRYLRECGEKQRLINGYGPTEGTTFTCCYVMGKENEIAGSVPIGEPIANTSVYILDSRMQVVPVGVIGDLYIGGDGLSRGYLNRPELTAEKFIPDPFSTEPGARLYKSGDLARFLATGQIEFLGRTDHQVKLRGFRIELGEIEAALVQYRAVREALVMLHQDESGDKRLVAYLVAAEGDAPSAPELRRFLAERLPEYMVPSFFVSLEEMPLTANGKVDRRALPAPDARQSEAVGLLLPRTPVEEMVCAVWAEVLVLEQVGVGDDFFELGGHSLLATQVVSRVRERFGLELALREVFEHPTAEALTQRIEALLKAERGLTAPAIQTVERDGALALSFAQQRLWFFNQLEPQSTLYNLGGGVRLKGELSVEVLEETLSEIVRRHEVLRTTFAVVEGEPVQVIHEAQALSLPVIDLSESAETEREAEAERLAREEADRPFDLEHGPLMRAVLLRLSDDEHVLLVTMHHIVSDGWSIGVLIKEVAALYQSYSQGEESPLEELSIQYADYSVWQREWLQGEALDRQLAYWKRQLEGAPTALELPTDRPRPAVQSYRGAQEKVRLSEELSERLRELSRREGVTLFMSLLAVWQTLLSRYTGQTDINVGTPIANRNRGETEDLIGFFVNLLVLRADLSGDPTFSELLGRVRETSLGAYGHQEMPFEKLVEELGAGRDMSRSPLFQALFVLQNAPMRELELPGLVMNPLQSHVTLSHFDLTLDVVEQEEGLLCTLEYNSDLFDAMTARRIINHFETLLDSAVTHPNLRLSALPMLTEAEQHKQLIEWNDTETDYPAGLCLHELFEAQAARTPEGIALVFEDERLSYQELNRRANRVAHQLLKSGVGPEVLVGVLMERSAEMIVALLGVLKAGGAYVPIDPTYPAERIGFMLHDAQVAVLLTQQRLVAGLPAHAAKVVCVAAGSETVGEDWAGSEENPTRSVTPDNLAYVIYTSGSTGKPKGVMITHGAVVNHNYAVAARYELQSTDRVLQFASLSFDVAVEEIFPSWLCGASVVVRSDRALDSRQTFLNLLEKERITVVNLSTAYWNELISELVHTGSRMTESLRLAAIGGEKGLPEHFAQAQQMLDSSARLLNVYGPTETTVTNTSFDFPREESLRPTSSSVPIGRPLSNTRLYVLDEHLRPVAVGVTGQLHISGESTARGYLHRAELTAEKFIPDPFSADAGSRLYRTGDLVRYLAGGEVEFVGRVDEQVKVRGFRIELGEIEALLSEHAGVSQAMVVARAGANGDKRLAAYVVAERTGQGNAAEQQASGGVEVSNGVGVSSAELRGYLKERLPDYMVPSWIVLLEELPLTSNGKVDRKGLPAPEEVMGADPEQYVAPRTAIEEVVCALLSSVLGVERVGLEDDFFELGGHSLLATQVISRVREACGVELPLRTLFEHSSAGELAQQVEQAISRRQGVEALAIKRTERDGLIPLSFAQQRLWFLDQLEPGGSNYNVPAAVRLRGTLNIAALERTLSEIVRRHEVLRTTFTMVEGEPVQVIHEAQALSLPLIDLSDQTTEQREAEATQLAQGEAARPFDLERGPLLRATLLRLSEEEHIVLLTMHHIVSDGWSISVLIKEVVALYESYAKGEESPLAELAVQYADYAVWQREWLQGEVLESQLSYWRRQLVGANQVLELPTDRPRPDVASYRGAVADFALGLELSGQVKSLSSVHGCTLYMTLLAGFATLLGRYTGQADILVGTAIAGRQRQESEELIGFFVNTLVLRADLSREPAFEEVMKRVREASLGAYAHQDVPFERLVEELAVERSVGRTPLFQVAFGVQNAPEAELRMGELEVSTVGSATEANRFELTLWMWEEPSGQIMGRWTYNTDLFEAARVEQMSLHLSRLLESAVAEPAERIDRLVMLTDEEISRRLNKKRKREESNVKKLKASRRQMITPTRLPVELSELESREGTIP